MVRHARWIMVPALLGLLVALPALAQNRTDYIQDEAALFSKEAKTKANGEIARIYAQHKREFVVDTVFSVKLPQDVDATNTAAVKRAMDEWAEKRAGREKVNGIELIIVGEPPTVRVELGNRTKQSGLFTDADSDELRNQVIANLKAHRKDPKNQQATDHVLLAATAFVGQRMGEHHRQASGQGAQVPAGNPAPQRQAHETPWLLYILIVIGILLAFWVIRGIFRGLSGAMGGGGQRMAGGGYGGGGPGYGGGGYGGGGYGGGGYGGGGGGGFMSGLLGGMFGAVAGNWMYNNMFGGHSSSAWGAGPSAGAGGAGPAAGNDADTSYSGTGGDYGDTGADAGAGADAGNPDAGAGNDGGDWGGGGGGDTGADTGADAGGGGGGDWGGGDVGGGGGGDFGGGGGGDFGGGGGGDFGGGGGGGGDW